MIETLVLLVGLYLALGLVFALVFHFAGLRRVDSGVDGGGWFFRLLITPGLVALWPVMAWKWKTAVGGGDPAGAADRPVSPQGLRAAHRLVATTLLVLLPLLVALGLWVRPELVQAEAVPVLETTPEPLPQVLAEGEISVGEAQGTWRLRSPADGSGNSNLRQIELTLNQDPALPALALYWTPEDSEGLPTKAIFLGPTTGPGTSCYEIPNRPMSQEAAAGEGENENVASWPPAAESEHRAQRLPDGTIAGMNQQSQDAAPNPNEAGATTDERGTRLNKETPSRADPRNQADEPARKPSEPTGELPADGGTFILYSLAHQERVSSWTVPAEGGPETASEGGQ